jgi:hypothetical protein
MRKPAGRKGTAGPFDRRGAIQFFAFGPWEFNVTRAQILARNMCKYRVEQCRPAPDWVGPNIELNEGHVERCDPHRPVLFATVIHEGRPWRLLIDGNHRVARALRRQEEVSRIVLDLEDTLKVLRGPDDTVPQMRNQGQQLGLLPTASVPVGE